MLHNLSSAAVMIGTLRVKNIPIDEHITSLKVYFSGHSPYAIFTSHSSKVHVICISRYMLEHREPHSEKTTFEFAIV